MKKHVRLISFIMAFVILLASVAVINREVEAKSKIKDGKYWFMPDYCTKFSIKKKKMTIKITNEGILYGNNQKKVGKKMTIPVAKNCKYYDGWFDKRNGKKGEDKITYSTLKSNISQRRIRHKRTKSLGSVAYSSFEVKNGKVVKITFFTM